VSDDELAAVIAAIQAMMREVEAPPAPHVSAWKRTARLEAVLEMASE
jgi:hypothetical protein